jgi:predicted AlkP superfamily pyrophosphatase or phosphodiesterase
MSFVFLSFRFSFPFWSFWSSFGCYYFLGWAVWLVIDARFGDGLSKLVSVVGGLDREEWR